QVTGHRGLRQAVQAPSFQIVRVNQGEIVDTTAEGLEGVAGDLPAVRRAEPPRRRSEVETPGSADGGDAQRCGEVGIGLAVQLVVYARGQALDHQKPLDPAAAGQGEWVADALQVVEQVIAAGVRWVQAEGKGGQVGSRLTLLRPGVKASAVAQAG